MAATRILIVEDEGVVALDLQSRLGKLGYQVAGIASSGLEAIRKASESKPDLILMDILLKGRMDGIETAEHIYKTLEVPVVFLTAYADERTLRRARGSYAFGYIVKPFNERSLFSTIEIALARYEEERRMKDRDALFAVTLGNISDAVVVTDSGGTIAYINRPAEDLLSLKGHDAVGKSLLAVLGLSGSAPEVAGKPGTQEHLQSLTAMIAEKKGSVSKNWKNWRLSDKSGLYYLNADDSAPAGVLLVYTVASDRTEPATRIGSVNHLESILPAAGAATYRPPYVNRAMRYIEESISRDVTLDMVAQESQCSKYYLCRAFKQYLKISPMKYLALRRLEKAKELLLEGRLQISQIAMETGFNSPSSFVRQFKRTVGMPPSIFRIYASAAAAS